MPACNGQTEGTSISQRSRLHVASHPKYRCFFVLLLLVFGQPSLAADDAQIAGGREDHWAWKPPVRPSLPVIHDSAWVRTPIDAFVLAKLQVAGLTPAPSATREQLLRRVTLD